MSEKARNAFFPLGPVVKVAFVKENNLSLFTHLHVLLCGKCENGFGRMSWRLTPIKLRLLRPLLHLY